MSIEAMKQALEHVQEFKRRWWAVPPFGNKVNKATREAVSAAHSPIFQLEDNLRTAIEQSLGARVLDEREAYITWMTTTFPAVYDVERVEHCWENGHISRLAWEGRAMLATAPQPQPKQEPISDGTEAVTRTVIEVEKLLCEKLGRKWQASGMSIQTLVDELAAQRPVAEPHKWVGLTDEEMYFAIRPLYKTDALANAVVSLSKDEYLAIEAKLREKNTGETK